MNMYYEDDDFAAARDAKKAARKEKKGLNERDSIENAVTGTGTRELVHSSASAADRIRGGSDEHIPRQEDVDNVANEGSVKSDGITLKVVAFHHAGYDPEQNNTVLFRMRGSIEHAGRVSATAVLLFLFMITNQETISNSFIALDRGGMPWNRGRECDLHESDYWIHSTNPEDPEDKLYEFPLVPHVRTWQLPKTLPSAWSRGGHESIKKTRSFVTEVHNPTGLELPSFCERAVKARDKDCVISGEDESRCERAYIVPPQMRQVWIDENMSALLGKRSFYVHTDDHDAQTAANTAANAGRGSPRKDRVMDMHHPMNGICLRADLNEAYDNGEFVFMPNGNKWVAHFLDPTSKLGKQFDHGLVRISQEIPRQFLMVRAAMTAFRLAKSFLDQPVRCEDVPAAEDTRMIRPKHDWHHEKHENSHRLHEEIEQYKAFQRSKEAKERSMKEEKRMRKEKRSGASYMPDPRETKPEVNEEKSVEPKRKSFSERAKQLKSALRGIHNRKGEPSTFEQAESTEPTLQGDENKAASKTRQTVPTKQAVRYEPSSEDDRSKGKGAGKGKQAVSSTKSGETELDMTEDNGEASQANHMVTFDEPEQPEPTPRRDQQKVFRPKNDPFFTA